MINNLKEAAAHIEKLEEDRSEQSRTMAALVTAVKDLKEELRDLAAKSSTLDGNVVSVPRTLFEEIKSSDVFCTAYEAHYEGIMKAYPMLRKDEGFVTDTMNDAITLGLRAVMALKSRADTK